MHIARFEHSGAVQWGVVQDSEIVAAGPTAPTLLDAIGTGSTALAALAASFTERIPLAEVALLAPIPDPPQFIGIGLNYRDHAEEAGQIPPDVPQAFAFLNTSIADPGAPILMPGISDEIDWEVELAIVIGVGGKQIPLERALDHVAGYTIVNDVSARDLQFADGQYTRGKSLDSFKPMGPWITTTDELGKADDLDISLWVNDVAKQAGTTAELIFDIQHLIHFLSQAITLRTGAVISTGTPPGVGFSRTPPEFLRAGDVVRMEIEGIGTMTNPVVAESESAATI